MMTKDTRNKASAATGDALDAGDRLQLVTFELAGEEFAVDILAVREINRMLELTRVPQSPSDVEGVVNLRGQIIPVLNLRRRFSLGEGERNEQNRIVVVEVAGRVVGFLVDRVHEVLRISPSIVDTAPAMGGTADRDFVSGVGKLDDRLLLLLDLDKLFAGDEELVDGAVAAAEAAEKNGTTADAA